MYLQKVAKITLPPVVEKISYEIILKVNLGFIITFNF